MIVLSSTGQGTPDATGVTVHWPSKYLYRENTDIFEALSLNETHPWHTNSAPRWNEFLDEYLNGPTPWETSGSACTCGSDVRFSNGAISRCSHAPICFLLTDWTCYGRFFSFIGCLQWRLIDWHSLRHEQGNPYQFQDSHGNWCSLDWFWYRHHLVDWDRSVQPATKPETRRAKAAIHLFWRFFSPNRNESGPCSSPASHKQINS